MIGLQYVQTNPALCPGTPVLRQQVEAEATKWWHLYLAVEIVEAGSPSKTKKKKNKPYSCMCVYWGQIQHLWVRPL